jgi:outer membrane receptor protein involved in Fe transport
VSTAHQRRQHHRDRSRIDLVEVDNLFDRVYYTYGTFTQLDNLLPGVNLSDSRTLSPSPGCVAYAGIRVTF